MKKGSLAEFLLDTAALILAVVLCILVLPVLLAVATLFRLWEDFWKVVWALDYAIPGVR